MPGRDAAGGHIDSLTEAVMGITGGLFTMAAAIDRTADAIEEMGASLPTTQEDGP